MAETATITFTFITHLLEVVEVMILFRLITILCII